MLRRIARAIFIAAALLGAGLALRLAAAAMPEAVEAALFALDVGAGERPSALKRLRAAPSRAALEAGGEVSGDLYRPAGPPRAVLVLVPGASSEGKDHPQLIAFAESLGRVGFAVFVPELRALRRLQITSADVAAIGHAADAASGAVPGVPLGIAAISYAVGPAVIAAMDTSGGRRADFVLGIGGYHDSRAAITYVTTGHFRASGEMAWRRQTPNAYGKWVFVLSNLDRLNEAKDRALLGDAARRGLHAPDATVAPLDGLSPDAAAVLELISNRDPERVPALIEALPASIRAEIEALSLADRDLGRLKARLILVHGRDDSIIPATESEALAAAVGAGRARLFIVDGLAHVDLDLSAFSDAWTLWRAARALLSVRR